MQVQANLVLCSGDCLISHCGAASAAAKYGFVTAVQAPCVCYPPIFNEPAMLRVFALIVGHDILSLLNLRSSHRLRFATYVGADLDKRWDL
jgi:hypothetical protein